MFDIDFVTMLTNLAADAGIGGPIWQLVNAFCWFMAFVLAMVAAVQLRDAAEQQQQTYRAPLMTFIAASMLMAAPTALVSTAMAVFGSDANTSPFNYISSSSTVTPTRALLTMVQLIGYFFFVRGILALREAGEPNRYRDASVGKALVIMGSGMAGVYIDFVLGVIGKTTGWHVDAFIGS